MTADPCLRQLTESDTIFAQRQEIDELRSELAIARDGLRDHRRPVAKLAGFLWSTIGISALAVAVSLWAAFR